MGCEVFYIHNKKGEIIDHGHMWKYDAPNKKELLPKNLFIKAAGSIAGQIYVNTTICRNGDIDDGIFIGEFGRRGGFLIRFTDLEQIYQTAKQHRKNKLIETRKITKSVHKILKNMS